jgi:hypothetical protein
MKLKIIYWLNLLVGAVGLGLIFPLLDQDNSKLFELCVILFGMGLICLISKVVVKL